MYLPNSQHYKNSKLESNFAHRLSGAKFDSYRFSRCRPVHAWGFLLTCPCISVLKFVHGSLIRAILTLDGLNDVILQPLVPFGGIQDKLLHLGVKVSENRPKMGMNGHFQAKLAKY